MSEKVRGGFGGALRSQMSEGLQRRIAQQEAAEARELAQEQREQRVRAEQFQETAIQAAVQAALEAGETFHPRMLRGERLGNTVSEFIQQRSELMDVEDQRREARQRAAWRELQAEFEGQNYGDTSAHVVEAERAEKAEADAKRDAYYTQRAKAHQRWQTIQGARRLARQDRREDRLLGR